MLDLLRHRLSVSPRTLAIYLALYLPVGFCMNAVGKALHIAEFAHWWQVLTCYGLYLVPASLSVRHRSAFDQYLWGLLFLGLLELVGYALGSSIAHPDNVLDQVLDRTNFSLAMTLFFAVIPPLGNGAVAAIERLLGRTPGVEMVGRG